LDSAEFAELLFTHKIGVASEKEKLTVQRSKRLPYHFVQIDSHWHASRTPLSAVNKARKGCAIHGV
jgi:hypothetical protein